MAIKICAENPMVPEYSLCGDAFDAPDSEDDVEQFRMGQPGETITCPECLRGLTAIRYNFVAHHSGEFSIRRSPS